MVVGSFTSISLDPPLVGFFPDKKSSSWPQIAATGHFCANILAADQKHHSSRFAAKAADKFEELEYATSPAGLPHLHGVLAWIEGSIASVPGIGYHLLFDRCSHGLELRETGQRGEGRGREREG